jgi:hypothetical protein
MGSVKGTDSRYRHPVDGEVGSAGPVRVPDLARGTDSGEEPSFLTEMTTDPDMHPAPLGCPQSVERAVMSMWPAWPAPAPAPA